MQGARIITRVEKSTRQLLAVDNLGCYGNQVKTTGPGTLAPLITEKCGCFVLSLRGGCIQVPIGTHF